MCPSPPSQTGTQMCAPPLPLAFRLALSAQGAQPGLSEATEIVIKASRGDSAGLPDNAIDDISTRLTYRLRWLTVPGS